MVSKSLYFSVKLICLIQVFMIFVFPLSLSTWIEKKKNKIKASRADSFSKKYQTKLGKLGATTNKIYFILRINISTFSLYKIKSFPLIFPSHVKFKFFGPLKIRVSSLVVLSKAQTSLIGSPKSKKHHKHRLITDV